MNKQKIKAFKKLVTDYLKSVGAQPHYLPHLAEMGCMLLSTNCGILEISGLADDCYELFTRFEEPGRARKAGRDCNPYSGKWNHWPSEKLTPEAAAQVIIDAFGWLQPQPPTPEDLDCLKEKSRQFNANFEELTEAQRNG